MEQVAHALGQMILRALPTFVLVLLLYFFLKLVFFRPLERVTRKRYEESEGALQSAQEAMAAADERARAYEQALREARAEVYRQREKERQATMVQCDEQIRRARAEGEQRAQAARAQIAAETEAAKQQRAAQRAALADAITRTVLKGAAR